MLKRICNFMPVFSIIIPTYNRPHMLNRAVISAVNQTFREIEIIVVDDGSNPPVSFNSPKCNDKIVLVRNHTNSGASFARNCGIKLARGKYISFLDDDDEYLPNFIDSTYHVLKNTPPNVGFSWCSANIINYDKHNNSNNTVTKRVFSDIYLSLTKLFEETLSIGAGFGLTIKKECLENIGLFNKHLCTVEDTDLFLRLLINNFTPCIIKDIHINIHNHHENRLTGISRHRTRISECDWLLTQYKDFFTNYPTLSEQLQNQITFLRNELDSYRIMYRNYAIANNV